MRADCCAGIVEVTVITSSPPPLSNVDSAQLRCVVSLLHCGQGDRKVIMHIIDPSNI